MPRVLAINASGRDQGTTSQLTARALEGAASQGAATEMVMLKDLEVRFCRNCLACYQERGPGIAPCVQKDDVAGVLAKIGRADGVIWASPVHSGFVSGLMTTFLERASFTMCQPTGELLGLGGVPVPRLTDKARVSATLVSAGMVPPEMRQYCDQGTPWLKEMAAMICNGPVAADMYAAAFFPRPLSMEEQRRAFLLRQLTPAQFQEAFDLGVKVVKAMEDGPQPYRLDPALLGITG